MKRGFPIVDICTLDGHQHEDLLISRFGPYLEKHRNLSLAHKHSFYHLVMFTKGGGTHAIDFKTFSVKPYQVYFMVPGQVHSWSFEGEVDGYIINFSAEMFNTFLARPDHLEEFPFFSGEVDEQVVELGGGVQQRALDIFEQLIAETLQPGRKSMDLIRVLMLHLFILVARQSQTQEPTATVSYNQTLLKNFRKLIDTHFAALKLPKDYAAMLYITPNHLNALCKDILNASAGELIRNRVILEARRLLVNPEMNINMIADQLNFADNSYFTKFFKKYTGQTPEGFRKKAISHDRP